MNHDINIRKAIPLPEQWIFSSLAAVLLCFVIYELRGKHRKPFTRRSRPCNVSSSIATCMLLPDDV